MPKYSCEDEILSVVSGFENGTIRREDWGHAEHLIVANHYLSENDFDAALSKMREGILNLLKAFEIDFSKEMPYHETMTVFWMRTVFDCREKNKHLSLVEICDELIEKCDKNYPLKFYSRELLFSNEARDRFVEPDLKLY